VLFGATLEHACRRAEEIRAAIRDDRVRLGGISASLGVALYPVHAGDAEALVRAADRALYDAKRAGRDRVHVYRAGA
jgi:diguanylate cyclase (GGDEF)-like protein